MRIRNFLVAGALLSLNAFVFGAPQETPTVQEPDLTQPLTLERAIQIGLQNQLTIGIAQDQLTAARARVTQARALYYPEIAPSYEYSDRITTVGTSTGTQRVTDRGGVSQISLTQLLFDTGRREQNVSITRDLQRAAELNIVDLRQAVILDISNSYYELLRNKELVRVAESSVERARTTLEATRAFAEVGTGPRKDILQAEADFANAEVLQIQARNNVRLAEITLKNAMGVRAPGSVITSDAPTEQPSLVVEDRPVTDYITLAFNNRPDIQRELSSIGASRRSVRLANIEAGLQVQLSFSGGYRFDPDPGENTTFLALFSYPLFDGGERRARVEEARANVDQAEKQLELLRLDIQQAVEQAYILRSEARSRLAAAQTALRAAQLNYEAARESLREGAGTIVDVITAQSQLVTAETNTVEAIYDYYIADARLQRSIGQNDPYLAGGE